MKKILLTLLGALVFSTALSQSAINADQVSQGVVHQWAPRVASGVPYFDASSNAQSTNTLRFNGTNNWDLFSNLNVHAPFAMNMQGGAAQVFQSPDTNSAFGITMLNGGTAYIFAQASVDIDSPISVNGSINATNNKVVNVLDGTAPTDASTFGQLTTTNANVSTLATQLNGYSMPTTTPTSGQVLAINNIGAKTTQWVSNGGGGGGGTTQVIPLLFNAGASGPGSEIGVNATVTVDTLGKTILTIPEFENLVVADAGGTISTVTSSNPAPIPNLFCPASKQEMPAIVTLNGTPLDLNGSIIIDQSVGAGCDITICRRNSGCAYGGGEATTAGLGNGRDSSISYDLTASGEQGYIITSSSTNGTVTPIPQVWQASTSTMVFVLTPDSGNILISSTDNCGPSGAQLGSMVGSNYQIPSSPSQNCAVSAVFGVAYDVTINTGGQGTATPPSITWAAGITPPTVITLEPNADRFLFSVTDNCNSGSPGGSLAGNDYTLSTVTGPCTVNAIFNVERTVTAAATTNGAVSPTSDTWYGGLTSSLPFELIPETGYEIDTVTDNCLNGAAPAGSLAGTTYTISGSINQLACTITATFKLAPTSYTVSTSGTLTSLTPSSDTWTPGVTTALFFDVNRTSGNQLQTITDNCDGGSQSGSLTNFKTYRLTAATSDCTITAVAAEYLKIAYFDYTAVGSIAVTPNAAFARPNQIDFGFSAPSASSLPGPQLAAIVNAIANESAGAKNYLAIGGATYDHAAFAAVGFPTATSNILAIIAQINTAISPKVMNGVVLDLEGPSWTGAEMSQFATDFHGAGLSVGAAPQVYYTGSPTIISATPTNMILTSGGGTGNNYGAPAAAGDFDEIEVQAYNTGGFTIDSMGEDSTAFTGNLAIALNNAARDTCSGPTPLCIKGTTKLALGNVANAGAGGGGPGAPTIFNPTAAQIYPYPGNTIPAYNQSTILGDYAAILTVALNDNPRVGGMMVFSINNDEGFDGGVSLYQPTDSATAGNFGTTIYGAPL